MTSAAGLVGHGLAGHPAAAATGAIEVLPRSAWAGEGQPGVQLADEPDVRFLLVHHTVNANDYGEADVVGLLRNIHRFHTGPERGWPDIAYNFIVDRFGRVWETRAGSLERTVAGDATGGNQGFDQKCSFLGDHRVDPPSDAAASAMVALLAWLADRSGIDTRPGATTQFVSRGSNRHPAGVTVDTPTITGHRTMSQTSCPGDAGFALVRDRFPEAVTARRSGGPTPPNPAAPTSPSTAAPTTAPAGTAAPTAAPTTIPPTTATDPMEPSVAAPPTTLPAGGDELPLPLPVLGAIGAGAVVLGTVIARRSRLG